MTISDIKAMQVEQRIDLPGGYLKRKSHDSWVLSDNNNPYRKRWGTAIQIMQDYKHFTLYGQLPPASGPMW